MLVFHSYKANGNNEDADTFVETVMGPNYEKFGNDIKLETLKSEKEDALFSANEEKLRSNPIFSPLYSKDLLGMP